MESSLAQRTQERLDLLAAITDRPGAICRTFLSPAMARANALVGGWMKAAGGYVEEDAWGNLIGRFAGATPNAKTLLLGSHLDTVPNAGKYDGPLGVLVALGAMEELHARGVKLPFHVDVIGFSDEEGTRFHSAYLGSGAMVGGLAEADLDLRDAGGLTVREVIAAHNTMNETPLPVARYLRDDLLGYVEVHIEQGPVLEAQGVALGVVDAIAAQTRLVYTFTGQASHAGTTPMAMRRDALAAGSELVLAVERLGLATGGLVATVGRLDVAPGASNVIPGCATLTVDLRHPERAVADAACAQLAHEAAEIATRRGLGVTCDTVQSTGGVACDADLTEKLARAIGQDDIPHLISGAGHDGVLVARLTPIAMLFVRCRAGLSHHPDEHVDIADIAAAGEALVRFLENFA